MKQTAFIKGVERLVRPIDVGTIHFFQSFTGMLPVPVQRYLMKRSEKQTPYIGFVVEPYPLFMCFEITNTEAANKLLPEGYSLIKAKITDDDSPKYYGIIGSFNAHTGGFWGTRQETYIIAQDNNTNLTTWVIIGIETNTASFEPKAGLGGPNADNAVVTTDTEGNIIVSIERNDGKGKIEVCCATKNCAWKPLDQKVWLDGNLSVTYGAGMSHPEQKPFSLIFNPKEVEKGQEIPIEDLTISENTISPDFFADTPSKIITFPYSQHFISDSPLSPKRINGGEQLIQEYEKLGDLTDVRRPSLGPLKFMLIGSLIFYSFTTIVLLIILLFQFV